MHSGKVYSTSGIGCKLKPLLGLGYYSRAARLFEGAKIVVQKFDGKLPDDAAVLQAGVPGIGRYSAGQVHVYSSTIY